MPRKVSLKRIVDQIDKALAELGEAPRGKRAVAAEDECVARTRMILKGARESVEGACFPNFDIPVP